MMLKKVIYIVLMIHGFSEVIFGLTHLLGFSFAPRIKNFKDQQLYGINSPKYYQELDYQVLPKEKSI